MPFPDRLSWFCPLCGIIWCLVLPRLLEPVAGEVDVVDMDDFLAKHGQKVRRHWGLADTTATPGQLFRYHFPADAFLGEIDHYLVKQATSDELPKWLYFNDDAATLEGIPTVCDVGQLFITVIAIGSSSHGAEPNSGQDTFTIEVLPVSQDTVSAEGSLASLHCDSAKEVTMLTITLDGSLNDMDAASRVRLMNRTMKYFMISKRQLHLVPAEDYEESFDSKIVLTSNGNALEQQSAGLLLQWLVGCGDKDSIAYKSALATLEAPSADSTLSNVIGLPVIGWTLATVRTSTSRQKRQEPAFENHTASDNASTLDSEIVVILETVPDFNALGIENTGERASILMEDEREHITPTLQSTLNVAATTSILPEKPSITTVLNSDDFTGISYFTSSVPSISFALAEATSFEHVMSTELLLQPSMVLPSMPSTKTVPLPDVPYQPTYTKIRAVDTLITPTDTTTQLPERPQPTTYAPDYVMNFLAGHTFHEPVPPAIFVTLEEGGIRRVRLVLTDMDGKMLANSSWIQVDPYKREIYGLPLAADVGKFNFALWANDSASNNSGIRHLLEVEVNEDPRSLNVHHEFVMLVKYDMRRYHFAVDWQTRLIKKVIAFFGDQDERNVLVRSMEPGVFAWTNVSLSAHPCPQNAIDLLLDKMAYRGENISTLPLRKVMSPEFRVYKVTVNLVGACEPLPGSSGNASAKTQPSEKPQVRNHIDHIHATQGRMLRMVVPNDTFFDELDGDTLSLSLRFLTINGLTVPKTSWIQFVPRTLEFRGLPMAPDVGSVQYQLVATNTRNASVADAFIITVVKPANTKPPSVEFSLHFNASFRDFESHPNEKYQVLYNLSRLYGDRDPQYITVRSVVFGSGSVIFIWTNSTLPNEPCPAAAIGKLVQVMFNVDGTKSKRLLQEFVEGYVISAEVIPGGVCLAEMTPTKVTLGPSTTVRTEHAYTNDEIFITTIVPAIVVAAMLVVAGLVACALYRNKRKGKVTVDEDSPFINKGIPIIFAEELEEGPSNSARSSKRENPLLPPPKYPQSSGSGASSPPGEPEPESSSDEGSGPDEEAENSPRYQRPPPLASNVDTSVNRPKHAPDYNLPPPYVPP